MYIAKNIVKLTEYKDIIFYKSHCGCGSDGCIHSLILEVDEDLNTIVMDLYAKVKYDFWNEDGLKWWQICWRRLRLAIKLLFIGDIRLESSFIFKDESSIRDYVSALLTGLGKLKVYQRTNKLPTKNKNILEDNTDEEERHL